MRDEEGCLAEPIMADCDWQELIRAAESAGRWAAREMARQCTPWQLGRTGRVWVRIEPLASPVATWMCRRGYGRATEVGSGVDVAIETTATDLGEVHRAECKARSVLVRRAYAAAYSTVLAEEAGVAARLVTVPDNLRVDEVSVPAAATPPTEESAASAETPASAGTTTPTATG